MAHSRAGWRLPWRRLFFAVLALLVACIVDARTLKPMTTTGDGAAKGKIDESMAREKAKILIDRGQRLLADGDFQRACEAFEEAHETYPDNIMSLYYGGQTY